MAGKMRVPECFPNSVLFQSEPREINFSPSAVPPCFPESYLYFCLNTRIAIISVSPLLVGKCFLISTRYFYSLSNRPSSSLFILFFFSFYVSFMSSFSYSTILNWAILVWLIIVGPFLHKAPVCKVIGQNKDYSSLCDEGF